jgi:eukaryotic-like serine/threonine-protein kinase
MGVIYLAEDPDIGRMVAIKLVRADLLQGDDREQFLARFRHEARAAGRCAHPNIVGLYDFAMHEGNPFLAMEYIDGTGLGQALKQAGRFEPRTAVSIITQVLDALGAAHTLGVVHRDVKPANILLLPSGQVKVTDFGISRLNTSDMTQDGAVIGTPAYMSPEQCRGEMVDNRSDLFSVGAVLYELLSGKRAFSGRNATEVAFQLMSAEPPDMADDVPAALVAVVRRAMAKAREARFATAQAMADALAHAMREDVVAGTSDRTVVAPPRTAFQPVAPEPVDEAVLDTIERRLARHVGPIARHLVRDAARRTSSIEALCEAVSQNIGQPVERERFMAESLADQSRRTGMTIMRSTVQSRVVPSPEAGGKLSAEQIERAERALIKVLGPIAKLFVKRALPGAASEAALWEQLATHIDRPADRDAFLRQQPKG